MEVEGNGIRGMEKEVLVVVGRALEDRSSLLGRWRHEDSRAWRRTCTVIASKVV